MRVADRNAYLSALFCKAENRRKAAAFKRTFKTACSGDVAFTVWCVDGCNNPAERSAIHCHTR